MSKHKEWALEQIDKAGEQSFLNIEQTLLKGIIFAFLYIGEVLERYLKDIATNTKRIGNG